MNTTLKTPLAVLSLLCACGHGASGGFGPVDGSAVAHDAASKDALATGDDTSSSATPDSSGPVDAGDDAEETGVIASLCVGLGAPCKDATTCLCGVGSGCTFDNVACTSGTCTVAYPVVLDAGDPCCDSCQGVYDGCTGGEKTCLAQWMSCNAACVGSCPVLCLAAQGKGT
jgi:hypothetical protein